MDKIFKKISEELGIREAQVEATVKLIDEGNTIPFIARYRKEVTGNLSDEILRDLGERLTYLRNLENRKEKIDKNKLREENSRVSTGKLRGMEINNDGLMELYERESDLSRKGSNKKKNKVQKVEMKQTKIIPMTEVKLHETMTVKEFAEAIKKQASEIIKKLFSMGIMATVNQDIDFDTAYLIAGEFGITAEKEVVVTEEDILFDVSDFFKILGDSTRAKIMWALDKSEMCVCDLAVLLGMTKSAISHQLKTLREANLVKNRKDGKMVIYSLDDDHVKDIFEKALNHVLEIKEREENKWKKYIQLKV